MIKCEYNSVCVCVFGGEKWGWGSREVHSSQLEQHCQIFQVIGYRPPNGGGLNTSQEGAPEPRVLVPRTLK